MRRWIGRRKGGDRNGGTELLCHIIKEGEEEEEKGEGEGIYRGSERERWGRMVEGGRGKVLEVGEREGGLGNWMFLGLDGRRRGVQGKGRDEDGTLGGERVGRKKRAKEKRGGERESVSGEVYLPPKFCVEIKYLYKSRDLDLPRSI